MKRTIGGILLVPALIALLGMLHPSPGRALPAMPLADGDGYREDRSENEDDQEEAAEEASEALGTLAALALAINIAYLPYKWLRRLYSGLKIPFMMPIHCAGGLVAFLAGAAHGFTAEDANPLLVLGLALLAYESVGGYLLRSGLVPGRARRFMLLLHAQRAVFIVLLLSLLLGHAFIED